MLGLGRRAAPDERDLKFLLRGVAPERSARSYRYWFMGGAWLNQGSYPRCVGYSWAHWLEDGPVTQPTIDANGNYATQLYEDAQKVDEWPGSDYAGTSVRAGAKVLQARGLISEYLWAFDLDTMLNTLLEVGPCVIGINWYSEMFDPDAQGFIHVGGSLEGGHAIVANGVNVPGEWVRLKNSWGRGWSSLGNGGYCRVSFADMTRLIREDGEICLPREVAHV